jgi:hypothetical protein
MNTDESSHLNIDLGSKNFKPEISNLKSGFSDYYAFLIGVYTEVLLPLS